MTNPAIIVIRYIDVSLAGGGFEVRRPFGGRAFIDPFLMLDHFGPVHYKPGKAVGAPDHPHRGQITVSYILESLQ
jgi:quercetin 2,3-dioxygenase